MSTSNVAEGQEDDPIAQFLAADDSMDKEGDADFEAAFNGTRSPSDGAPAGGPGGSGKPAGGDAEEKPDAEADKAAADAAAAASAAAKAEADAAAAAAAEAARIAAEANAPVTLTQAELDQLRAQVAKVNELEQRLQQTHDTTAGRLGSLNQTIETLKAQAAKGKPFTIKQLARMEKEWPEIAELLKQDLSDALGVTVDASAPGSQGAGSATVTPPDSGEGNQASGESPPGAQPFDPLNDPAVVKVLREKEMAIVDTVHPGWRGTLAADGTTKPGLIHTPDFQEWRNGLNQAAQQLLASTWDSNVLRDAIADFKKWQGARQAQAEAVAQERADAHKKRDARLQHGMPATTGIATGAPVEDEDAAFREGFKSVRGR